MYNSERLISEQRAQRRRRPLTARQMVAQYGRAHKTGLSLKDQVLVASGQALIPLGRRLKSRDGGRRPALGDS